MGERAIAAEARDLTKDFDGKRAVDRVSLTVPGGSITGILGPNGAGKTTTIRMMLGIIDPTSGSRSLLGNERPLEVAQQVGYLPEERGLYPAMPAAEAIAFLGALRGLPLKEGRRRALQLLQDAGHEDWSKRQIVLDEPFAGLDAINQQKLEQLIRDQAAAGVTVIFSTHVIAHAERLCERIAIIAEGRAVFEGDVNEARGRLRPIVHLRTRSADGTWRTALPDSAALIGGEWRFELPASGPEPLLKALIEGGAGIETLSIERPGLHDAFIVIAGEAAAREMGHVQSAGEAA
jgi:ABC-2 type transport system ATP-binding protein